MQGLLTTKIQVIHTHHPFASFWKIQVKFCVSFLHRNNGHRFCSVALTTVWQVVIFIFANRFFISVGEQPVAWLSVTPFYFERFPSEKTDTMEFKFLQVLNDIVDSIIRRYYNYNYYWDTRDSWVGSLVNNYKDWLRYVGLHGSCHLDFTASLGFHNINNKQKDQLFHINMRIIMWMCYF